MTEDQDTRRTARRNAIDQRWRARLDKPKAVLAELDSGDLCELLLYELDRRRLDKEGNPITPQVWTSRHSRALQRCSEIEWMNRNASSTSTS